MGVRLAPVTRGALTRSIRTVGFLDWATPHTHEVSPRISGWVEKLYADTEGMHIEKGEKLFELYSPELQVAVEEAITARKLSKSSESSGVSSALYSAARRKLEQWGVSGDDIDALAKADRAPRTVPFRSPVSGDLIEKKVIVGSAVSAGELALKIVDRSTMWLDAQLFPMDLGYVKEGQRGSLKIEGAIDTNKEGIVTFIDPRLDPITRTARVRFKLENNSGVLKAGMFATVSMESAVVTDTLLVPHESVITTGLRDVVFVAQKDGHFDAREVSVVGENGKVVAIQSGVKLGEEVVVSGQFLLDAESRMREGIRKYLTNRKVSVPTQTSEWQDAVDNLVIHYLEASGELARLPTRGDAVDFAPLRRALDALAEHKKEERIEQVLRVVREAEGATLDEQREMFKSISEGVVNFLSENPPSVDAGKGEELSIVTCPMNNGRWLQATGDTGNPYFGESMKGCAKPTGALPLKR